MTNKEAYEMIMERSQDLISKPDIQRQLIDLAKKTSTKDAANKLLLMAVATLYGKEAPTCS